jgi:hypothetical protein
MAHCRGKKALKSTTNFPFSGKLPNRQVFDAFFQLKENQNKRDLIRSDKATRLSGPEACIKPVISQ